MFLTRQTFNTVPAFLPLENIRMKDTPFCIEKVLIALIIQIIQLKIAEDSAIEFCYTAFIKKSNF